MSSHLEELHADPQQLVHAVHRVLAGALGGGQGPVLAACGADKMSKAVAQYESRKTLKDWWNVERWAVPHPCGVQCQEWSRRQAQFIRVHLSYHMTQSWSAPHRAARRTALEEARLPQ